jgi:hypothetical protein
MGKIFYWETFVINFVTLNATAQLFAIRRCNLRALVYEAAKLLTPCLTSSYPCSIQLMTHRISNQLITPVLTNFKPLFQTAPDTVITDTSYFENLSTPVHLGFCSNQLQNPYSISLLLFLSAPGQFSNQFLPLF